MEISMIQTMETIRKNPRKFFIDHLDKFEGNLNLLSPYVLLQLLFSSVGIEVYSYYTKVLRELSIRDLEKLSGEFRYYYWMTIALGQRFALETELAQSTFQQAYTLALKLDNSALQARALIGVSSCFYLDQNFQGALNVIQSTLRLVPHIHDDALIADIYSNYALILNEMGNSEGAFTAFNTALLQYDKLHDKEEHVNYCALLGNMASSYLSDQQFERADELMNQVLKIIQDHDFLLMMQGAVEIIADYYGQKGQYDRAFLLMKQLSNAQISANVLMRKAAISQQLSWVSHASAIESLQMHNRQLLAENAALHQKMEQDIISIKANTEMIKLIGEALRTQSFVPYFQAVWETNTQRISAYEVLVRWQQLDGNVWTPIHFIELIEESPLIIELSEQVIRKGLHVFSTRSIIGEAKPLYIGFNIAPYQLVHQDLVKFLESACLEYSVPRRAVTLEITERTFIEHNPHALAQLHALKKSGFNIALDDFGTGYSSLGCIAELPIDIVKIDRSLIRDICDSEKAYHLFKGIIYMLKSLGIKSVAEGVETIEQLNLLCEVGCDQAQGYLVHRPDSKLMG